MSANATSSYKDVTALDNSKVHAGHVYQTINNFGKHAAADADDESPKSLSTQLSQTRVLAPTDSRVHELLCQAADFDARDESDLPALYYAAARGDEANVKLLLDSGADVNLKHDVFMTPIWIATLRGHTKVVQNLLKHHAVTALYQLRSVMGTVMHCAFYSGSVATIECLLEAGVSPNEKAIEYSLTAEVARTLSLASLPYERLPASHKVPGA
ncbi:hypothetical protein MBLNU13_g05447t1 [Cladosporium sp. NU13]